MQETNQGSIKSGFDSWSEKMPHAMEQRSPTCHEKEGFPAGSVSKELPAMQETWVRFLGWEDPLEEEMATHSRTFAWKIPWTEEPGGLQSMGSQELDTTE